MDRRFLSHQEVVAASRSFVCVRLSTYESAEEESLLESFFVGRSGDLENTTFVLLSPDGKRKLSRAGRSPDFAFPSPEAMAAAMRELGREFPGRSGEAAAEAVPPLPGEASVRLALNVAACDGLPLAVVVARDDAARADLARRLAKVAADPARMGRAVFAIARSSEDLAPIPDAAAQDFEGLVLVQPDRFGVKGRVLARGNASDDASLREALDQGIASHRATAKESGSHVRAGRSAGVSWKTAIPVTDPGGRRGPREGPGRRGGEGPERRPGEGRGRRSGGG